MTDPPRATGALIPLHAVSFDAAGKPLTVRRRGGRPRKVVLAPSASEQDFITAINDARDQHVAADVLVAAVEDRADADQVLGAVVEGLARETASLAWEMRRGRALGRDVAQLCSRRIDGLSKIALVQLGRARLGIGDGLGPNDPRRRKIVDLFMSSLEGVFVCALPAETSERLLTEIEGRLRVWESANP